MPVRGPEPARRGPAGRGARQAARRPAARRDAVRRAGREELRRRLPQELAIAAVNAPGQCTVAGPSAQVEALAKALSADGIRVSRLRTSHAFHSPMVQGAVEPFRHAVAQVRLSPPRLPYVSSVTGAPITAGQATDPGYWAASWSRRCAGSRP
ncbi:acyltransferase domain-containing protein [Streptomyces lydicus]|nr:acyltransferase domain-containing protein [Streptomyces lydicus]